MPPNRVSTWKRQAVESMANVLARGGRQSGPAEAEVKELRVKKITRLAVGKPQCEGRAITIACLWRGSVIENHRCLSSLCAGTDAHGASSGGLVAVADNSCPSASDDAASAKAANLRITSGSALRTSVRFSNSSRLRAHSDGSSLFPSGAPVRR